MEKREKLTVLPLFFPSTLSVISAGGLEWVWGNLDLDGMELDVGNVQGWAG